MDIFRDHVLTNLICLIIWDDSILRLFLKSLPNSIVPVISAIIAWSFGLLASKSSATLGRPPVISFVLAFSVGTLARTSPAETVLFFSTDKIAFTGNVNFLFLTLLSTLIASKAQRAVDHFHELELLQSITTLCEIPVDSSILSSIDIPSTKSSKSTLPDTSANIGLV